MGVREERAAKIIAAIDRGEYDAMRFIRSQGEVHVLVPYDDRPARHKRLFGDDPLMRFMLGEEWSVCAKKFIRHQNGFDSGAQLVSHFPDEQLCYDCHKPFGDRGVLIFEANQDDGREPEEIGRLDDDFITKGQALR